MILEDGVDASPGQIIWNRVCLVTLSIVHSWQCSEGMLCPEESQDVSMMSWMTGVNSDRELQPRELVVLEIGSRFEGTCCTLSPRLGSMMSKWACTSIQKMDAGVWKRMFAKELSDALQGDQVVHDSGMG